MKISYNVFPKNKVPTFFQLNIINKIINLARKIILNRNYESKSNTKIRKKKFPLRSR